MQTKTKKEISEQKRLESLQNREKIAKQKSLLISNSLNQTSEKKVNFDDNDGKDIDTKLKLFKDDSDISDFEDAFSVKDIKLKNISLHFQNKVNDKRFKLDENFLDTNITNDVVININEKRDDEKAHSLSILNSIINIKPMKNKKHLFKDINQFRYDPEASDHKRFEVEKVVEINEKSNKKSNAIKEFTTNAAPISVTKERFSEINSNLKNLLKSDEKFKLSMLFDDDYEDNISKDTIAPLSNEIISKAYTFIDSSSEEESADTASEPIVKTLKSIANVKGSSKFFFEKDDNRLATNFYRPSDIESLKADWLSKRQHYVDSYRKKKKVPTATLR